MKTKMNEVTQVLYRGNSRLIYETLPTKYFEKKNCSLWLFDMSDMT